MTLSEMKEKTKEDLFMNVSLHPCKRAKNRIAKVFPKYVEEL